MGLLTAVLTLPLAPVRGVVAVAEQVRRQAEEAWYDPDAIRAELEEVERLRRDGEISAEDAVAWEDDLIARLMAGGERHG